MGATRHLRRSDRGGDCPPLFPDRVLVTRDDQQVPMRCPLKDVTSLVAQIRADAAADVRPALREVADQALSGHVRVISAHRASQHGRGNKVPSAIWLQICRHFLHIRSPALFLVSRKSRFLAISSNWHADCYTISVHLVPRQRKGRCSGFSGPAHRPFLHPKPSWLPRRPAAGAPRS